jgi:hypothetical protein
MTWTISYFIGAYLTLLIGGLLFGVRSMKTSNSPDSKGHRVRMGALIMSMVLLPFAPYLWVEIVTWRLAASLLPATKNAVSRNWQSSPILQFKVLDSDSTRAHVYVVMPALPEAPDDPRRFGTLLSMRRVNGHWNWDGSFETVWSDVGNANGSTFPPYAH